MNNLICLCPVYISDAPILNPIWMYISRFRVFIYITWRFFDVKEYEIFKSILISSVPVYISTCTCRLYKIFSCWYIVNIAGHVLYEMGVGAELDTAHPQPHHLSAVNKPALVSVSISIPIELASRGDYSQWSVRKHSITHLCLGVCGGLCLYRQNSHVWKFHKNFTWYFQCKYIFTGKIHVQYTWKQHFTWNSHKIFHVYFTFSECFSQKLTCM